MSNNLVINPYLSTLNYSNHFPLRSPCKVIRSSSSPKSSSLILYYPIPVPYSRIRSSKNSAIFYSILSEMPSACLGAKTPSVLLVDAGCPSRRGVTHGYPKQSSFDWTGGRVEPQLNGLEGGFEPDLNGFLNQKQSAATTPQGKGIRSFVTAGRVAKYSEAYPVDPKGKPQLNGLERGFADKYPKGTEYSKSSKCTKGKPDLNYFFPTQCDRVPWSLEHKSNRALPIPFREGGWGVRSIPRAFDSDSFRVCAAVNPRFPQAIHSSKLPPLNPTINKKIDGQNILLGFRAGQRRRGPVGVEFESNCSRITVN